MVVLSCSNPTLGLLRLQLRFHLLLTFCHTPPPGILLDVKWPCRRGSKMTVFNCSSSNFSHANVPPSALYLKNSG